MLGIILKKTVHIFRLQKERHMRSNIVFDASHRRVRQTFVAVRATKVKNVMYKYI